MAQGVSRGAELTGTWRIERATGVVAGSPILVARAAATNEMKIGRFTTRPTLEIRCSGPNARATLVFGTSIARYGRSISVESQVDGSRPIVEQWSADSGRRSAVAPFPRELVERLMHGTHLHVQLASSAGLQASFALDGLDSLIPSSTRGVSNGRHAAQLQASSRSGPRPRSVRFIPRQRSAACCYCPERSPRPMSSSSS
jgi:hypothetical protein